MRNIIIIFLLFVSVGLSAQITTNTNFQVNSANPIDTRMVLDSLSDTTNISFPYEGLMARIKSLDVYWEYTGEKWQELQLGGGVDSVTQVGTTVSIYSGDSTYTIDLQQEEIAGIWYVAESGDNNNAIEGNINFPLADPWAAIDSATAGELVVVFGGSYDGGGTAGNLFKNGVTLLGFGEPEITRGGYTDVGTTNREYIFKFNNANDETMTVLGDFIFSAPYTIFTGNDGNLGGEVTIECKSMTVVDIADLEAPERLNIRVKNAVNQNGDNILFQYVSEGFVQNSIINLDIENITQNFGEIIDPDYDQSVPENMTFNVNIQNANAQFSVVYGASTAAYHANTYNINIENARDIFGPIFIGNYLSTYSNELTTFNLRCASCVNAQLMVPPTYSDVKIVNSSFLSDVSTGAARISITANAKNSAFELYNVSISNPEINQPVIRIDSVSQSSFFATNSYFETGASSVLEFRNGPATGQEIKIVNSTLKSASGGHANIAGDGDIYVGGVYNSDQNTTRDPDINFIEIDDYLSVGGGGSTTLFDSLASGNVTIDQNTSSLRLDTLNQFVAVTENSQALNSLNGNITITTSNGNITLNGGASGEIKLQGDSLDIVTGADAFGDGLLGVVAENDAGELRVTNRLLPQFDTVNVSTANDTIDLDFAYDQSVVVNMTSAPATVDFVVENPTKGSTLTFIFTSVGSSHTFNFGHTDIQLGSKTGWTIDGASAKVYVLRYSIDGGGDWIILRDE
jgi:hypothetical protein